jgi:hypothetical protein
MFSIRIWIRIWIYQPCQIRYIRCRRHKYVIWVFRYGYGIGCWIPRLRYEQIWASLKKDSVSNTVRKYLPSFHPLVLSERACVKRTLCNLSICRGWITKQIIFFSVKSCACFLLSWILQRSVISLKSRPCCPRLSGRFTNLWSFVGEEMEIANVRWMRNIYCSQLTWSTTNQGQGTYSMHSSCPTTILSASGHQICFQRVLGNTLIDCRSKVAQPRSK